MVGGTTSARLNRSTIKGAMGARVELTNWGPHVMPHAYKRARLYLYIHMSL